MFENILRLLGNPSSYQTPLPEADAKHAIGALLVRAAKIDKAYLFEEVEQIDHVLAKLNNLNIVEAAKMRAACERLEEEIPDTDELTQILHAAIGEAEKEATVRALWSVIFADGVEHIEEDELMHQIERVLGLTPDMAKRLHDEAVAKRKSPIISDQAE